MEYTEGQTLKTPNGTDFLLLGIEKTEMVFVETGSFTMGKDKEITEISLSNGFFIGKYACTQALYEKVMVENPSRFEGENRPVEQVSWDDVCTGDNSFLEKLNRKIAKEHPWLKGKFALPSESQWEYAARGAKVWNSPWLPYAGSQHLPDVAWFESNNGKHTVPVGLKQANALGLHDMSGNVWEWCADGYQSDKKKIPQNGDPYNGDATHRVLRGGSCFDLADRCRSADRSFNLPGNRDRDIGFRLILTPVQT